MEPVEIGEKVEKEGMGVLGRRRRAGGRSEKACVRVVSRSGGLW